MINKKSLMTSAVAFLLIAAATAFAGVEASSPNTSQDPVAASGIQGGFVVHVGCGDGKLTTSLKKSDAYLVHGLDTDWRRIRKARERILSGGHNGTVSVAVFDGRNLPYIDNTVNFMLCAERYNLSDEEILRVLAPRGKAILREGGKERTLTKPWPDSYDEWTHYLHEADNNAVSKDTAITAPIQHLQWTGSPDYSRHHDKSSSLQAAVTANGRVFYIMDVGPGHICHWRSRLVWQPELQAGRVRCQIPGCFAEHG